MHSQCVDVEQLVFNFGASVDLRTVCVSFTPILCVRLCLVSTCRRTQPYAQLHNCSLWNKQMLNIVFTFLIPYLVHSQRTHLHIYEIYDRIPSYNVHALMERVGCVCVCSYCVWWNVCFWLVSWMHSAHKHMNTLHASAYISILAFYCFTDINSGSVNAMR